VASNVEEISYLSQRIKRTRQERLTLHEKRASELEEGRVHQEKKEMIYYRDKQVQWAIQFVPLL